MRIEWPTVAVAAAIAAGFGVTIALYDHVPVVVELLLFGVFGAWYGSLQHEVSHGHPTPWSWVNRMLVSVPLGLVYPFERYRVSHLEHHDADLTDPIEDPETTYVTIEFWQRASRPLRALLTFQRTVLGRMTVAPLRASVRFWADEVRRIRAGEAGLLGIWVRHLVGVALVLLVVARLGVPVWVFVVGTGWLGLSLTLLRSFAEHRAVSAGSRSATVDAGRFFSLLYLNNNHHHAHHAIPGAPWYELPELCRSLDGVGESAGGAGFYPAGYAGIIRQYLVRPVSSCVWPLERSSSTR